MMNARLNKALVALLTVATVGACDDPPVEPGNTDAARLTTNPSFVVIEAGSTREVQAILVNDLANPVAGNIDFAACNDLITVDADADQNELEPGTIFEITGVTLGESCVVVEGAGFEDTIGVRVVPAEVVMTAGATTLRAGEASNIDVELRNSAGVAVGPFAESDATFESDNEAALFFTDDAGGFDTEAADRNVTVTVTFESFGVERTLDITFTVLPAEPESGMIVDVVDATPAEQDEFPATVVGDTVSLPGILFDSIGNINDLASDIESVTVESADETIATAFVEVTEDADFDDRRDITVFVVGEGGGQTEITVTAHTVSGDIDMGTLTATVLAPLDVVSILPADANAGEAVVIAGTLLEQPGAETHVFVEGQDVTDTYVTAITPTAITLTMPGAGAAATYEITVDVGGGATSESMDYAFGGEADEPENDDETATTLPINHTGWFGGSDDFDIYAFDAVATETLDLTLDWDSEKDLDVWVQLADGTIICESYFDHPEVTTCDLEAGTTYYLVLNDFSLFADGDELFTRYTITLD